MAKAHVGEQVLDMVTEVGWPCVVLPCVTLMRGVGLLQLPFCRSKSGSVIWALAQFNWS